MQPPRVVSLLPSATEIVCALGFESALVGISHECDFPATIRARPVLTRPRIDTSGSSAAIDGAVRALLHDALSVYAVDEAQLAALEPDVVLTQDLCDVCAVSLDDVRSALARNVQRARIELVSLRPTRLANVLADVERVAFALGSVERGRELRARLQQRIELVAAWAGGAEARPRVATIEWLDPLMLGGLWMPELIELAGGNAVGVRAGEPAPTLSPEQLSALQPDVVVVKPCGFTLTRALAERSLIERSILAVLPRARVYLTDGNAYFNRPGPRLVESLEILAACVQPEHCAELAQRHAAVIERLA